MTIYIKTVECGRGVRHITEYENKQEFYEYIYEVISQKGGYDSLPNIKMKIEDMLPFIDDSGIGHGQRYHREMTKKDAIDQLIKEPWIVNNTFLDLSTGNKKGDLKLKMKIPLYQFLTEYILECVETEGYEDQLSNPVETKEQKAKFLKTCFEKEYINDQNRRRNRQDLAMDWLQGLPASLNIAFTNYDIEQLYTKAGHISSCTKEKDKEKMIEEYWPKMAARFHLLTNKD